MCVCVRAHASKRVNECIRDSVDETAQVQTRDLNVTRNDGYMSSLICFAEITLKITVSGRYRIV